jgi:predicted transcriptional regulator
MTILRVMDNAPLPSDDAPAARRETEADRQRRLAWEAEMIAEARAELDAGLYATSAEVKAWIDSIGTDHELPLPPTRRR